MTDNTNMSTEPETKPDTLVLQGRESILDSGAKVWGALHESSTVWKFTSTSGAVTTICLSQDAMRAMMMVYQGLVGVDRNFVSVMIEEIGKVTGDLFAQAEGK